MEDNRENTEYFECLCNSPDHLAKFVTVKWSKSDATEMYVYFFLIPTTFWQKLKRAWVYLIRRDPSRYGSFDEFMFRPSQIDRFIKFLERYKKIYEEETKDSNISKFEM